MLLLATWYVIRSLHQPANQRGQKREGTVRGSLGQHVGGMAHQDIHPGIAGDINIVESCHLLRDHAKHKSCVYTSLVDNVRRYAKQR